MLTNYTYDQGRPNPPQIFLGQAQHHQEFAAHVGYIYLYQSMVSYTFRVGLGLSQRSYSEII